MKDEEEAKVVITSILSQMSEKGIPTCVAAKNKPASNPPSTGTHDP